MVVERRVKKYMLAMSLVIATVLFLVGFGLGMAFDNLRESEIDKLLTKSQLDMESFLLQQQILSKDLDSSTCTLAKTKFVELQSQRGEIGQKLDSYESKALTQTELNNLKRKHILLSVSSLMVLDNLKENCGFANLDSIIFFYKNDDDTSTKQGLILDKVYERFPDTLTIFAIDANFSEEPLVDFLKDKYDITRTPTIIINDKTKFEGLTQADEIIGSL